MSRQAIFASAEDVHYDSEQRSLSAYKKMMGFMISEYNLNLSNLAEYLIGGPKFNNFNPSDQGLVLWSNLHSSFPALSSASCLPWSALFMDWSEVKWSSGPDLIFPGHWWEWIQKPPLIQSANGILKHSVNPVQLSSYQWWSSVRGQLKKFPSHVYWDCIWWHWQINYGRVTNASWVQAVNVKGIAVLVVHGIKIESEPW